MANRNILISGGAGFIGSHLVDRMIQEGNQVVVVDNLSTGKKRQVNRNARFYRVDIQSKRLDRIIRNERPVLLVHLAAQMNVRHSTEDPAFDAEVNILGTFDFTKVSFKSSIFGKTRKSL